MIHFRRHISIASVLVLLSSAIPEVLAQSSNGQVEGTVSDTQQGVLPQTSVSLLDGQGHVAKKTVTDPVGHYTLSAIAPGNYTLQFARAGFQQRERISLTVTDGDTIHKDVSLLPEMVSQTVTVSAIQDPLTTSTPTGSRLGLEPLETPAALFILTNDVLESRGYEQIEEAVRSMPGTNSGGSPGDPSNFVTRGFAADQVTLLRDGLYFGPANMINREENSFNLQSIEMLSGPSSVLYGQGAVGGTINVVTMKPTFSPLSFNTADSYGSFNTYEVGVGGGGAINHSLAFRTDFSYYSSDGYVKHSNPNNLNGTGSLLWNIRKNLSARLSLDVLKDDLSSYYGTPYVPASFGTDPVKGVLQNSQGLVLDARMRFTNYNVSNPTLNAATYEPNLTFVWQPSASLSVTDQVYYYHADRRWENAETYTFLGPNNGQVDANNNPIPDNVIGRDRFHVFHTQNMPGNSLVAVWSNKIFGLTNKVSAGDDFYHISFLRRRGFPDATYADWVDPLNPAQGVYGDFPGDFPSRVSPTKLTDNAGYFEDALNLSRKLILVTGIRFENLYLDRRNYRANGAFQAGSSFSGTYHPVNYRAGAVYNFKPGLVVYGQFSTAQDPPGNDIFIVNKVADAPFQLSRSKQGEGGIKAVLPNSYGEITFDFYYISRDNILSVNPITSLSSNDGQQKSKGIELTTILHPTHLIDLSFSTAYGTATYGYFLDPNTGLVDTGKTPADVPNTTANLWVDAHKFGRLPLEIGGGLHFEGSRWGDNANQSKLYNYATFDAYGSYRLGERVKITARGKNIFDKAYAQWGDIYYPTEIVLGAPRSYTLSLTGRF
jgi:iron complex outermembrane recepter protein